MADETVVHTSFVARLRKLWALTPFLEPKLPSTASFQDGNRLTGQSDLLQGVTPANSTPGSKRSVVLRVETVNASEAKVRPAVLVLR